MIEIEMPQGLPNIGRALEVYFAEDLLDDYECERSVFFDCILA